MTKPLKPTTLKDMALRLFAIKNEPLNPRMLRHNYSEDNFGQQTDETKDLEGIAILGGMDLS